MKKQNYFLLLSFITGFSVMVIELTATRIVAPILGSSIYTWTSAIGIMLLGGAIGNGIGGKIIDKHNKSNTIAIFFLAASVFVLFISPASGSISDYLLKIDSLWFATLIAMLVLFLVPAFLLGSIYPMLAKQYLNEVKKMGQRAGLLSAFCSAGSIVGTFLTGFYFAGYLGSVRTLLVVSIILFISSLFLFEERNGRLKASFFYVVIILLSYYIAKVTLAVDASTVYHKESGYYDIKVADKNLPGLGKTRILFLDAGSHNIKSLSNKRFDSYVNFHPVFSVFNEDVKDVMMIGGGAFELSENFKNYYPEANILTVEIDPEVIKTAKEYFGPSEYITNNTVSIDGRVLLSKSTKKYDVIFSDAYNSFISVPWHLATKEFFELTKSRLSEDGIFAMNFISARHGESLEFYESLLKTFSGVYDNYYVFNYGNDPTSTENVVLIGVNSKERMQIGTLKSKLLSLDNGIELAGHLQEDDVKDFSGKIIFTDDFAPIDRLMMSNINDYFGLYMDFIYQKS